MERKVAESAAAIREFDFVSNLDEAEQWGERARAIQTGLDELKAERDRYERHEKIFNLEATELPILDATLAEFKPIHLLWTTAADWLTKQGSWLGQQFGTLRPSKMEKYIMRCHKNSNKALRMLKNAHAAGAKASQNLKTQIEAFRSRMPIIKKLRHPGIRRRHWKQLNEQCNLNIPPTGDWNLYFFLEQRLERFTDIVTKVADVAINEYNLEQCLERMKVSTFVITLLHTLTYPCAQSDLQKEAFLLKDFKDTNTFVLSSTDDLITLLDDQTITIQTMLSSPYITPLEEQTKAWQVLIKLIQRTISEWLACQRQWMYLSPIFQSDDISR